MSFFPPKKIKINAGTSTVPHKKNPLKQPFIKP